MGKGTDELKASPDQLEREVEEIRGNMEPVIAELDHRRHHAVMVWRRRLRGRGAAVLGMIGAMVAGTLAVRAMKKKRQRRLQDAEQA